MIITILSFLLTIGILCIVHELGHYSCARCFRVFVEEFSIGVGKIIFHVTNRQQTKWSIRCLPLGGFVRFAANSDSKAISGKLYSEISIIKRMLIVLAGPAANFVFAIILLIVSYSIYGKYTVAPAVVSDVIEGSAAARAGIRNGDLIVSVNQMEIRDFEQLIRIIQSLPEVPTQIMLKRNSELITVDIVPEAQTYTSNDKHVKRGVLGIKGYNLVQSQCNMTTAIVESISTVGMLSKMILSKLKGMLTRRESLNEIHGVITIARVSHEALDRGINTFIVFLAMLSVNLGVMNLLPIPMLDGGQFLYLLYIMFRGEKSVNTKIYNIIIKIGIAVTIFFVVISLSNDIKNLYSFLN